jgi:hypothetical protein
MKKIQKIILVACLLISALGVTACGRYSEPYPQPGSGFPHNYPQK